MGFLDSAGGYTPIPDVLVKQYDFTTAYVWGIIWRYTQMETGTCRASHETIAERAGMSQRSLINHLKKLIKDGYIEDLTPNLSNKPHTYCTKKGEGKIKSTMQNLHSNSTECAEIAQQNAPTMQNLPSHYAEIAQPTMQNLHPKKDSKETSLRESKIESPKQKMFRALAELCRIDLSVASDKQMGLLGQAGGALAKKIQDIDQFKVKFNIYWTEVDWRGQKGQPPLPAQIREVYGDYCHWLENPVAYRKNGATNNGTYSNGPKRNTDPNRIPSADPYAKPALP